MAEHHPPFESLQSFAVSPERRVSFYSLPRLEEAGIGKISRLPVCVRILLESLLRNCDGVRVHEENVRRLARWQAGGRRTTEIPFTVGRILLQDFTGVPVVVDLAAMRSAASRTAGGDASAIEPLVPVDLVIDHSVQVDFWGSEGALQRNMQMEMKRNGRRYEFLKWGAQAFRGFNVVPPGVGICHQVNLEYLAKGVIEQEGLCYPDTVVGTDSHTTMINGLGVLGWGVGGIEAEAGMLGQPIYFLEPDVIGVHLSGALPAGTTATDLVLRITEMLRKHKVVGKFVEFFGEGAASLSVQDRATIGNMAPEYGATVGFFPPDEQSVRYLAATGRSSAHIDLFRSYYTAQGMFGMPLKGEIDYSDVLELDLGEITTSVSGPKRPQDRIPLPLLSERFRKLLQEPIEVGGYGKEESELGRRFQIQGGAEVPEGQGSLMGGGSQNFETISAELLSLTGLKNTNPVTEEEMVQNRPTPDRITGLPSAPRLGTGIELHHGDIVIASITSCTNTSNPSVMLAAGLLAKKAVERGLSVAPHVKTSLGPGSRVVTEYLERTGLQPFLDRLGFRVVGYGCITCIGNSGPLDPSIERTINENDIVAASVLSGNRNFEARIHQSVRANFLMSPPLVVAFALAGRIDLDLTREPLGKGKDGADVYLRDLWPTSEEISDLTGAAAEDSAVYRRLYADFRGVNPLWDEIPAPTGSVYVWDSRSTYIQEPPFLQNFRLEVEAPLEIANARALAIFGDSITTDHISPAGAIKTTSPAAQYLLAQGVPLEDFNTYGARRGNHQVMVRGTFANVRIKNLMVPGIEGGVTIHQPSKACLSIFEAASRYQAEHVPLLVFAGQEYGTGSSRDWAAKGTALLGVRAVVAQSFERIHRSNLIQMGVLPCQFPEGINAKILGLDGSETFHLSGLTELEPGGAVTLRAMRESGEMIETLLKVRLDTQMEADYYRHGGILPYVLRRIVGSS